MYDSSPDEDHTISSASLCMSPSGDVTQGIPLDSSTPIERARANGAVNGYNRRFKRRNNNDDVTNRNSDVLSSRITLAEAPKRKAGDVTYFIAKELLMTERTYKRDLELLTVVSESPVFVLCHGYDNEEPEYRKIADLLFDYLSNTYDAYAEYTEQAGALVALVESARRRGGAASREATAFEATSPLPLSCLLLRPLHRLLHYCDLTH
ncbi:unnamed protein product, partial [Leptidea sinapis]